jgi:acetylornithine deacetylase/succinyl-diaminopimelate desuccinylase-like protein
MKESALCEEVEALLRDAEARVEDLETVMADELAATHQPEPPPTPPPTDPVWATLGPRASDTRRREAEVMTMIQVISHH